MAQIRAASFVPKCPRCLKPIHANAPIEVFQRDEDTGRTRYAHLGCRPPLTVAAHSSAPAGLPDEQDEDNAPGQPAAPVIDTEVIASLVREAISNSTQRLRKELGGKLSDQVNRGLEDVAAVIAEKLAALDRDVAERFDLLGKHQAVKKIIVIKGPTGSEVTADSAELFHPKFDRILRLAAAGKNIFLPGPTGLGKTHLVRQVARFIPNPDGSSGRTFGMLAVRLGMADSELLGRSVPDLSTGRNVYHRSDFVKCYEEGGVFLLDEVDAGDPNTLITVNAAIANGILPVPARTEKPYAERHPLFVCVAAANTFGSGADRQYVGRSQLDESTLDRFRAYIVPMDYDEALEMRLCPHPGLYALLKGWRDKIRENKLERVISTRFFAEAYDSVAGPAACQSLDELAESFFGGWTDEEQTLVLGKPLALTTLPNLSGPAGKKKLA